MGFRKRYIILALVTFIVVVVLPVLAMAILISKHL